MQRRFSNALVEDELRGEASLAIVERPPLPADPAGLPMKHPKHSIDQVGLMHGCVHARRKTSVRKRRIAGVAVHSGRLSASRPLPILQSSELGSGGRKFVLTCQNSFEEVSYGPEPSLLCG